MSSECIFQFDYPNKIYFSGETISGCVRLQTKRPKHVKTVYLLFEGTAKVRWGEPLNVSDEPETNETSRGDEIFIKDRTNIFSEGRLPPGKHVYNFSIPLPAKCQTSCTEKLGEISYILSLHIERELRYHNIFWQQVTVIKPLNLNCDSKYLKPIQDERIKYICCFPCCSGPIISTLFVPYNGWAPGQDIVYTLKIENKSRSYDVQGTKLLFLQTYFFTCSHPKRETRTIENHLDKLESQDRIVLRRTQREFKGRLRVPSVPPSTLNDASLIQISYRIGIEIQNGECHLDSYIWIPITIGTTPLIQSVTDNTSDVMKAFSAPTSPDMPPSYDMCMPTSYLEPTLIGEKFKDTEKDKFYPFGNWLPKYPVYNKFTDDLSIQIAGLQNAVAPQTNLFLSEIIPSAPLVDAAVSEKCNTTASGLVINQPNDPNFASTSRNCRNPVKYGFTDEFLDK